MVHMGSLMKHLYLSLYLAFNETLINTHLHTIKMKQQKLRPMIHLHVANINAS